MDYQFRMCDQPFPSGHLQYSIVDGIPYYFNIGNEAVLKEKMALFVRKIRISIRSDNEKWRKVRLTKAFFKWAKLSPLNDRCDELSRIIKERTNALESVRESYLRDVIIVKYYLEMLNNIRRESNIERNESSDRSDDMYDLHTIPSINLRKMIDRVQSGMTIPSSVMHEALLNAGLINPSTSLTFKPWELSQSYRRLLKYDKGNRYEIPDLGGQTIPIANPSNHKVLIKLCNNCIGLMSFVRNWNNEVEDALRLRYQSKMYDKDLCELRMTIAALNSIISTQEGKIVGLELRNQELTESSKWKELWEVIGDTQTINFDYQEKIKVLHEQLQMAQEDFYGQKVLEIESTTIRIAKLNDTELNVRLNLEDEKRTNKQLSEDIDRLQYDIEHLKRTNDAKSAEIKELEKINSANRAAVEYLTNKVKDHGFREADILNALESSNKNHQQLCEDLNSKIDDLTDQLASVTNDYNFKENEVDALRDSIREMKINYKLKVPLESSSVQVYEKFIDLEMIPLPKPTSITLRVVALAIMWLVKIRLAWRNGNFKNMGIILRNICMIGKLRKDITVLNSDIESLSDSKLAWESNECGMRSEIESYKSTISYLHKRISFLESENDLQKSSMRKFENDFNRAIILAQIQRNLVHDALKVFFSIRRRISLVRPDQLGFNDDDEKLSDDDTVVVSSPDESDGDSSVTAAEADSDDIIWDPEKLLLKGVLNRKHKKPAIKGSELLAKFKDTVTTSIAWGIEKKNQQSLLPFAIPLHAKVDTNPKNGIVKVGLSKLSLENHDFATRHLISSIILADNNRCKELTKYLMNDFTQMETLVTRLRESCVYKNSIIRAQKTIIKSAQRKIDGFLRRQKMSAFKAQANANVQSNLEVAMASLNDKLNSSDRSSNTEYTYTSDDSVYSFETNGEIQNYTEAIDENGCLVVTFEKVGIDGVIVTYVEKHDASGTISTYMQCPDDSGTVCLKPVSPINHREIKKNSKSKGDNAKTRDPGRRIRKKNKTKGEVIGDKAVSVDAAKKDLLGNIRRHGAHRRKKLVNPDGESHNIFGDELVADDGPDDSNLAEKLLHMTEEFNRTLNEVETLKGKNLKLGTEVCELYTEIASCKQRESDTKDILHDALRELEVWKTECGKVKLQNSILRESVEESYRKLSEEKDDFLGRQIQRSLQEQMARMADRTSRGTNITCSVCAIRNISSSGADNEASGLVHLRDIDNKDEANDPLSATDAFILVAKPRNINELNTINNADFFAPSTEIHGPLSGKLSDSSAVALGKQKQCGVNDTKSKSTLQIKRKHDRSSETLFDQISANPVLSQVIRPSSASHASGIYFPGRPRLSNSASQPTFAVKEAYGESMVSEGGFASTLIGSGEHRVAQQLSDQRFSKTTSKFSLLKNIPSAAPAKYIQPNNSGVDIASMSQRRKSTDNLKNHG